MPIKRRGWKTERVLIRIFENGPKKPPHQQILSLRINADGTRALIDGDWVEVESVDPEARGGLKYQLDLY